jgi:hypothetical protein
MLNAQITAPLAPECLMLKYTGGRDRPSREEIARLAYCLYEKRGGRDGHALDDWLSAEQELMRHYQ